MTTLLPTAIYQHQGAQYLITSVDFEGRRAYGKRVFVDWYTEALPETEVQVLYEDECAENQAPQIRLCHMGHGEVHLRTIATLYKRIRFYTNENLETGPIDLPPEEMDTTAFWIVPSEELEDRTRLNEGGRAGAIVGLAQILRGVAPLFVHMGRGALRARGYGCHAHWRRPAAILHDTVPGGVGLASALFEHRYAFLGAALDLVTRCTCQSGCPSCIGIGSDLGRSAKEAVRDILELLTSQSAGQRDALSFEAER
jgi:DEAD/DEAH box helicase domain-containing protein